VRAFQFRKPIVVLDGISIIPDTYSTFRWPSPTTFSKPHLNKHVFHEWWLKTWVYICMDRETESMDKYHI